ncbi:peptide ABC transporter ATP-binding protein [Thalassospira sp. TSL5-1]|uniref:peptide ABC transporter ATP-binding protein n=1 Tax=Thalassospira sp. TSL5-1 TaxID=1544451 RepID=UPI00093D8822|nr:peptide ABC transporter ATP-binding protein [Thalassospira sp. TSL5-1]OKH88932.1 peptide ABC transporter ATP-binding protein [Thalassospira sp. TSL5-1]
MSFLESKPGVALMECDNLARHYSVGGGLGKQTATVKALDGVSFSLESRKTLAVVGESGCGKSTLGRQLTLIEKPSSGALKINGDAVGNLSEKDAKLFRRTVQMIFQNPYGSLNPRKKVGQILEEPVLLNMEKLGSKERQERVRDTMAKVGLRPEFYGRYPHMFSGGQRQRIAIARALILEPKVIVADEPVSALDVSVQAQVLNLMMDLQDEMNVAYVFISHDLSVVRHIADDVMVMYLGRVAEKGPTEDLFNRPLHPYTRALLASAPKIDPAHRVKSEPLTGELPSPINPPSGCAFHKRCPFATEHCAQVRPELRMIEGREVACHRVEEIS